jgi:two-component system response regulator RstA
MSRILLVEDDERLAALTAEYLREAGYAVEIVTDGSRAAGRILAEPRPDLVILDIMLPGESGLSVLRRVREPYRGPILVLTARGDDVDELLGFELGADDYVAKPARPRLLLARVQALLRRARPAEEPGEDRLTDGDLVVDRARREVRLGEVVIDLTTAEFDELFEELRGIAYDGLDRSMDVRMSQLRKRLFTDHGRPSRIVTVRGAGYQFVPGGER